MVEKTKRRLLHSSDAHWLVLFQVILIAATFFYLYASVLAGLVSDWWEDPNYSHGFLIPPLSIYFVWQKREQLCNLGPRANHGGLIVFLIGLSIFFLGYLGVELFLMRFSMVVVISGLVFYVLGWRHIKLFSFPIAFLMFMIPFPAIVLNAIALPLQVLAAKMSTFLLQLINLPVLREGNLIFLPRITLEVTEACSGLRSLVSLTALAVVFAYLSQRNIWKQSVLVVSAVPIAVNVNALRIWGTGVLTHMFGIKIAQDFYHGFTGWLLFVAAFGLLLAEGYVLSWLSVQRTDPWKVFHR